MSTFRPTHETSSAPAVAGEDLFVQELAHELSDKIIEEKVLGHAVTPSALARTGIEGKASGDAVTEGSKTPSALARTGTFVWRQMTFLGPGIVASCAYTDPGNWTTDLAGGAGWGYAQLFVILAAILSAMWFQILATRLGIVSGKDLAEQCRASWHTTSKRPKLVRWLAYYPLYVMSELSMIFTDMGELIGSAIAINLISNGKIPLYAGVLITCADVVLVLLAFYKYPPKSADRSVRSFELMMGLFVLVTIVLLGVLVSQFPNDWGQVFLHYLPNGDFVPNGGLYAASGIIGATLAPNAIYLGSKVACVQRTVLEERVQEGKDSEKAAPALHELPKLVKVHLRHAAVDISVSLVVCAVVINSLILILAASATLAGNNSLAGGSLFSFFDLVDQLLGRAPAILYALAVLASGLAAGLVVTLAGQIVSEGYLHWSVKPWMRRLATRAISMVPALVTAIAVGPNGVTQLLLIAQVANSLCLPFIICPLLWFTSDPRIMTVITPVVDEPVPATVWRRLYGWLAKPIRKPIRESGHNFATSWVMDLFGWLMIATLTVCNLYGLVQVGQGQD